MGAPAQRLFVCLLCCLLVGTLQAHAKIVKQTRREVALNYDSIQSALDSAGYNDLIQLPSGTLSLTTGQFLKITTPVQLKGAPEGTSITYGSARRKQAAPLHRTSSYVPESCLVSGEGKAILEICSTEGRRSGNSTTALAVAATIFPIIVDGISFIHTGSGSGNAEGSDSFKAIAVKVSGPSSSSYGLSTISNCHFSKIDVGVELFAAVNWGIEGNTFDNTPRGVWLSSEPGSRVRTSLETNINSNAFIGFAIGVGCDDDDLIYGIDIASNTFDASTSSYDPKIGIQLSANIMTDVLTRVSTAALSTQQAEAPSPQQSESQVQTSMSATFRDWLIEYNAFVGVNYAIFFSYSEPLRDPAEDMRAAGGSLSGVNVNYNSMELASGCTVDACAAIWSQINDLSGLDATNDWYGSANPSTSTLFKPADLAWSAVTTPYTKSYSPPAACPTAGFCVDISTIVRSTAPQPIITSFTFSPTTGRVGSSVTAIVTLGTTPPCAGTVSFTSTPAGVTCPTTTFTKTSANPIRVTCTMPDAIALVTQAAAAQAALVQTAALQYGWRRNTPAPTTINLGTRQFTMTATVTATIGGLTATSTQALQVCANQPWPFRADVHGCEGCTYDCATGFFACASCSCHCPHSSRYAQGEDSRGNTPYGSDSDRDTPYGDAQDKPDGKGTYDEEHHNRDHYGDRPQKHGEYKRLYGSAHPYDQDAEAVPVAGEVGAVQPGVEADAEDRQVEGDSKEEDKGREGEGEQSEEAPAHIKPSEEEEQEIGERIAPETEPVLPRPRSLGDVVYSDSLASQPASDNVLVDSPNARERGAETKEEPAGGSEEAFVSVAATWHPLTGAGESEGYEKPVCSGGKPQCICGPVPLKVTPQCTLVTYDACANRLECSSSSYSGY